MTPTTIGHYGIFCMPGYMEQHKVRFVVVVCVYMYLYSEKSSVVLLCARHFVSDAFSFCSVVLADSTDSQTHQCDGRSQNCISSHGGGNLCQGCGEVERRHQRLCVLDR